MKYFIPHQTKPSKTKDVREPRENLSRNTTLHMKNPNPTKRDNLDLNNIDHVRSSRLGAVLFVFEDNEEVDHP